MCVTCEHVHSAKQRYRKVPMVATLVTLGVVTFGGSLFSGNTNHVTKLALALFSEMKNKQQNIKKKPRYLYSVV